MRTLLILIALARTVTACSCGSVALGPICQRIGELKVLFVGKAIARNDLHEAGMTVGTWYKFTVDEVFQGLQPTVREVIVDPGIGSCQISFTVGSRYLVFSYAETLAGLPNNTRAPRRAGLVVSTGECTGTRLAELVSTRDLEFARQYRAAPGPPGIVGSVRIHAGEFQWSDRYPPLAGASITLAGSGAQRTATTGPDGAYEFPNVPPGNYLVTAYAKVFFSSHPSYDVEVPAQGCGLANIGMFTDGGRK